MPEADWPIPPSCICCCDEHTFGRGCPAYHFGICRGQNTLTMDDLRVWAAHYKMTLEEFLADGTAQPEPSGADGAR